MSPEADLAFAQHLADVAREVTMAAFGQRLAVSRKYDNTIVTEIDAAAENAIRAVIAEHRPDDGVLGEEGGLAAGASGRVWVIDPIDGTLMFAEGIPMWTTLVALKDETGTLVGVADAPAITERCWATRGGGAWLQAGSADPRQIHVSDVASFADSFVLHASVEEFTSTGHLDALLRLTTSTRGSRGLADAWAHTVVARGSAEAIIEAMECHEWDWAATALILTEAGGEMTHWDGGDPTPGCRLIATNGLITNDVFAAIRPR